MAIADQDNNSSPRASNNIKVASLAAAANANCMNKESRIGKWWRKTDHNFKWVPITNRTYKFTELYSNDGGDEMEQYAWLEPRHDPIVRDTNFAEIDFENFKNDDLAYAFSCGVSYTDRGNPI